MIRGVWLILLYCLGQGCWAQSSAPNQAVVRLPGGGAGIIISSDGLIAVPSQLATAAEVSLDGASVQAKLLVRKPGAPFALMKLARGPFYTLGLGDPDLLSVGDTVEVWTPAGGRSAPIKSLTSDPITNLRYMSLEMPFESGLAGWPVLRQGQAVAIVTGPEPGQDGRSRAISVQELKLLLFNEGLPPLTARPFTSSIGTDSAENAVPVIEEWEFPFGSGTQRVSDMLELESLRYTVGTQGARLAPLVVDARQRLYAATLTGTVYCLDFANRQMLWRAELGPGGFVLAAPQLTNDDKVLLCDGRLGAVSAAYRRTSDPLRDLFQDIAGRAHNAVSTNTGECSALASESGEELWRAPTRFPSPPLLQDQSLLVSGLGFAGAIEISNGSYRWVLDKQHRKNRPLWYSLQHVAGTTVYGVRLPVAVHGGLESDEVMHLRSSGDAEVVALDWQSGRELWAVKLPDTDDEYQPLGVKLGLDGQRLCAVFGSRIFILDTQGKNLRSIPRPDRTLSDRLTLEGGTLYGGDAEGWYAVNLSDGRVLWHTAGAAPEAAPILHAGTVYGTSHHSLTAFNARSGQKLWERNFAHRISGQPALRDNHLYLASIEGRLYRVKLP